jgi:hypothetical protein
MPGVLIVTKNTEEAEQKNVREPFVRIVHKRRRVSPMAKDAITLKKELLNLIEEMTLCQRLFVQNPTKDFTRNRKLPLETMLRMMISRV